MYLPKHFKIKDEEEIFAFIEANAFGQLISNVKGRHFATHLPFLLSADRTTLFAHLAKQNPQHTEIENQEALITFSGPHAYISPSWYSTPGVPTWNYQAVHVYGQCKLVSQPVEIKAIVEKLTHNYEAGYPSPWQPEYHAAMLNAIIGVKIDINEIQAKYKLSQNRPAQDQTQVIRELGKSGAKELAAAMQRNENDF
jgi:transcriptional regulator